MKLTKLTALALTAALACAVAVPAFAESAASSSTTLPQPTDNGKFEQGNDKTQLIYVENNYWEITIPANIELSTTKATTATITAGVMNIQPDKELVVHLKDDEDGVVGLHNGVVTLTNTNDKTNAITTETTISLVDGPINSANAIVATFAGTSTEATGGVLSYSALPTTLRAGTYTGTVNFMVGTEEVKG